MQAKPFLLSSSLAILSAFCLAAPARSQDAPPAPPVKPASALPDSPRPQPTGVLTLGQRFNLQVRTTFGLPAFLVPAADAAVDMADPPDRYPREWRDGGEAFGRLYGAEFARHTAAGMTHFTVAAIDREDPRYYPSTSTNFFKRTTHAIVFTVIDKSDSGHHMLAISNIAGSAAGGAVGMAFYPDGYRDITHAYQRAAVETTSFAAHNLIEEFSPEIVHVLRAMHFPDRVADAFLPPTTR